MSETKPQKRAREFFATRKALIMGTVNKEGRPTASHAPFVWRHPFLYVYTSGLSRHTDDLKETGKASVLLAEDEAHCLNIFARIRITFSCSAISVQRENDEWREIMDLFEKTFKDTVFKGTQEKVVPHLRRLTDFTLFRLHPHEAIYVEGFGKAYQMTGDLRNPIHIKGTGPCASAFKPPERMPPLDAWGRKMIND